MSMQNISLSGRKEIASNKKMTFWESTYLFAVVKGLVITMRHFFQKPVTIQYPEQARELSPVYRGQHTLMRDEEGRERCTACGLCALSCPAEAITLKAAERQPGEEHLYREEKYAVVYEINMLRCIFCGLCEEACPKAAIFLTKSRTWVKPRLTREDFIWGKDKLVMPLEAAKANTMAKEKDAISIEKRLMSIYK